MVGLERITKLSLTSLCEQRYQHTVMINVNAHKTKSIVQEGFVDSYPIS